MSPDLIGTKATADLLGVSHRTVHRLVVNGDLEPAFTAPGGPHGVFLFDPAEVDELVKARRPEPAAQ